MYGVNILLDYSLYLYDTLVYIVIRLWAEMTIHDVPFYLMLSFNHTLVFFKNNNRTFGIIDRKNTISNEIIFKQCTKFTYTGDPVFLRSLLLFQYSTVDEL